MTDADMKREAMMHLEYCGDSLSGATGLKLSDAEVQARVCAAHYLIQALDGGHRPANFDEVLEEAREFERAAEAALAKG